jgi:hypothetical protein
VLSFGGVTTFTCIAVAVAAAPFAAPPTPAAATAATAATTAVIVEGEVLHVIGEGDVL